MIVTSSPGGSEETAVALVGTAEYVTEKPIQRDRRIEIVAPKETEQGYTHQPASLLPGAPGGVEHTPDEEEAAALAAVACYMDSQPSEPAVANEPESPKQADEPAPPPIVLSTDGIIHRPDEEEAAAALAAVACYLEAEQRMLAEELARSQEPWQWWASKVMLVHGLTPARAPHRPNWGNIERLRQAGSGVPGIVGL